MKRKLRGIIVNFLASTIGNFLILVFPKKAKELSDEGITLVMTKKFTLIEQLMRKAILIKVQKQKEFNSLSDIHKKYWAKQGKDFFLVTKNNLETIHLPRHKSTFDALQKQLEITPSEFKTIVEIGTGNGIVLNFLNSRFPELEKFIGLDLSQEQISINQTKFKDNPKLEFVATDVLDWVETHGKEHMIFFTFRGVMEYFNQEQLTQFFKKLNSLGKTMFFALEPNGLEHDFEKNPDSMIYGVETSFSHNYQKLFEDAGFNIWHLDKMKEPEYPHHIMSIIGAKNF